MRTPSLRRHSFTFLAGVSLAAAVACSDSLEPGIEIVLSQPSVDLRAIRGTTTPITKTITVSNSGDGRLGPVSCPANPAPWLACSVSSGNIVTLTATPTGLGSSPASVSVPFTAPGAGDPQTVSVSLIIDQPVLTLSASTANFIASEGAAGTTPGSATITVTNTGAGTLANLGTITCAPTPANARVGCVVNQSAGTLVLTVDPAGLAPGTYVFPVSVSSPNDNVTKTIAVTLANSAIPKLVLSQGALLFQMLRGGPNPVAQTISVTNGGGGNLGTVTCPAAPATWLSCAVGGGGTTLTFSVNPTGLTTNPTPVSVPVTATGASNSPQSVLVTFNLRQPVLSVSTLNADFVSNPALTATTPAAVVVTVTNSGEGTLSSLGAISCTPPVNSPVTCVVDQADGELTLTVDPAGITSTKIYQVVVSAPNSNVTRTITVTLTTGPTIGLSPKDLNFQAIRGTTAPIVKKVKVSNTGSGTLGTVTCPTNPAAWLTCAPGTTADTLVFTAVPTGLTQSPPDVAVPVSAIGAFNSPENVMVSLTILQPILSLSASTETFTVTAGGAPVSKNAITASNTGAGTRANLGTISCGIAPDVHVGCSVNQTNGQITLTVSPNTAPAFVAGETHVFTVTIGATNMGNSVAPTITLVVTVQ
jgi:hypothetical protein